MIGAALPPVHLVLWRVGGSAARFPGRAGSHTVSTDKYFCFGLMKVFCFLILHKVELFWFILKYRGLKKFLWHRLTLEMCVCQVN